MLFYMMLYIHNLVAFVKQKLYIYSEQVREGRGGRGHQYIEGGRCKEGRVRFRNTPSELLALTQFLHSVYHIYLYLYLVSNIVCMCAFTRVRVCAGARVYRCMCV